MLVWQVVLNPIPGPGMDPEPEPYWKFPMALACIVMGKAMVAGNYNVNRRDFPRDDKSRPGRKFHMQHGSRWEKYPILAWEISHGVYLYCDRKIHGSLGILVP